MSVIADAERTTAWSLTDLAWGQLEGCGIALAELYRLVRHPQMRTGSAHGQERLSGYGITAVICGSEIRSVEIDGADAGSWQGWARERAQFGDSKIEDADRLVAAELRDTEVPRPRRRKIDETIAGPLHTAHVLDEVHPSLRKEVARLVTRWAAGDYRRLVIHSPTSVSIT